MTENQQKALENLKRFIENDLQKNFNWEKLRLQPGWDENKVMLSYDNSPNTIISKYKDGRVEIVIILEDEWLDKRIKEFRDYIENIDDDIFVEACEDFKNSYGKDSIEELNQCIDNKSHFRTMYLMNGFLKSVSKIARNRIESMIFKYFPEYREFIEINRIEK